MGAEQGKGGAGAGGRTRERGASLLELMVALVAAATILGAIISTLTRHSLQRQTMTELNLAAAAALDNIEELRSVDYAQLATKNGVGFDVPGLNGAAGGLRAKPGDLDGLPGKITVAVEQSFGAAVLYRAQVEVEWVGAQGTRSIRFETLLGGRK